ncbi:unnamed protein product [Spodoptera exigua]|nr:unnamed protein product [Spodoptera exigua]
MAFNVLKARQLVNLAGVSVSYLNHNSYSEQRQINGITCSACTCNPAQTSILMGATRGWLFEAPAERNTRTLGLCSGRLASYPDDYDAQIVSVSWDMRMYLHERKPGARDHRRQSSERLRLAEAIF